MSVEVPVCQTCGEKMRVVLPERQPLCLRCGVVIFLTARTAHDLQHLCGMVQMERTRDDGRHPYPSVSDASLKEIRETLSAAWRAQ